MKWRRRRDSCSSDPIRHFRSVFFARTDCASPVVRDQTDSRAHGEVRQKSFAFHPPPFCDRLEILALSHVNEIGERWLTCTSLSCCFPAASMKATVSKNGYRHSIAGVSVDSSFAARSRSLLRRRAFEARVEEHRRDPRIERRGAQSANGLFDARELGVRVCDLGFGVAVEPVCQVAQLGIQVSV